MTNNQVSIDELRALLSELTEKLQKDDFNIINELIDNREWGIAIETLCTQIYEYDIKISPEFYEKLASFAKSLNMQSTIWLPLRKLIIPL